MLLTFPQSENQQAVSCILPTAAQGAQSGQSMDAETEIQVMRDVVKDGIEKRGMEEISKSCIVYVANQKKARNMDVYWVFNDLYQSI